MVLWVAGHDLWVKYMKMMEERHKDLSPMWATGTDALTRTTLDNVFSPVVPPRPVSGYIGGLFKAPPPRPINPVHSRCKRPHESAPAASSLWLCD